MFLNHTLEAHFEAGKSTTECRPALILRAYTVGMCLCVCVCLHACNTHTGPFLVLCLSEPGGVGRGKGVYHLMTVLLYDIGERKGKKSMWEYVFYFMCVMLDSPSTLQAVPSV